MNIKSYNNVLTGVEKAIVRLSRGWGLRLQAAVSQSQQLRPQSTEVL